MDPPVTLTSLISRGEEAPSFACVLDFRVLKLIHLVEFALAFAVCNGFPDNKRNAGCIPRKTKTTRILPPNRPSSEAYFSNNSVSSSPPIYCIC
ncbi:hypothetical protein V6N12_020508 [Hibiscus sabdariffa]|uniref:Uncharacterized protein n=1 Tax=Hibiscus sabdariffa TaxID=183260 RepID=A0ABR2CYB0_9ROSI